MLFKSTLYDDADNRMGLVEVIGPDKAVRNGGIILDTALFQIPFELKFNLFSFAFTFMFNIKNRLCGNGNLFTCYLDFKRSVLFQAIG